MKQGDCGSWNAVIVMYGISGTWMVEGSKRVTVGHGMQLLSCMEYLEHGW